MKHVAAASLLIAVAAGSTFTQPASAPLVDCHQHLFSPAAAAFVSPPAPAPPIAPITAEEGGRSLRTPPLIRVEEERDDALTHRWVPGGMMTTGLLRQCVRPIRTA